MKINPAKRNLLAVLHGRIEAESDVTLGLKSHKPDETDVEVIYSNMREASEGSSSSSRTVDKKGRSEANSKAQTVLN